MSPPPSKPKSVHKHWHPLQGFGSECEVKRRHGAVTCDGGLREVKQNKRKETPTRRLGEKEKLTCRRRRPRQFIHTFRMRVRSCYIFRFIFFPHTFHSFFFHFGTVVGCGVFHARPRQW